MGAKIASFLATLLLSIPLAAIGLMAVFGVPELVPAGNNSDRGTVLRNVQNALHWGDRNSASGDNVAPAYEDAPSFGQAPPASNWPPASSNMSPGYSPGSREFQQTNPQPSQTALASNSSMGGRESNSLPAWSQSPPPANRSEPPSNFGSSGNFPSRSGGRDNPAPAKWASDGMNSAAMTKSPATGPLLSWKDASLRLTELGIKNFHLERGANDGTFLFVCMYSPGDAPQVIHRFESEADDPLLAVNQALQQVDNWMQNRFAQANFPPPTQSYSLNPGSQR